MTLNAIERLERAMEAGRRDLPLVRVAGPVREVTASAARVAGVSAFVRLGDRMGFSADGRTQVGEVVRIDAAGATVKPFESRIEAGIGSLAHRIGPAQLRPDPRWKGRVIDALGRPVDGLGPLAEGPASVPLDADPPAAMTRARVKTPLPTGVRAIDLFTPLCAGQRIGIFAGSGVGKSTLLAMLAGAQGFDSVVVALVGERGREVREFLEGPIAAARDRAVIVVSTGDESPMMRRQAPKVALAVAESFRDRGESVLLIVDSVTRYAHAARDVALAAGEPAVARGYPPSVFSDLPRLLERAGPGAEGTGTITGIFSVLVDGDDHNDPVADSIRGTLDGHVVLDRAIAEQGRYPAIELLGSISRLAGEVWTGDQRELVRKLKSMMARFEETRDLRLMGGYRAGSDPDLDQAVSLVPRIYEALRQEPGQPPSRDAFLELAQSLRG
ncbi:MULTISPECIES: flagellar protein export ATPase FliI [Methylobacteriaceae]|jgi:flagellum-specific ATP synthase|uniref:Flagellum-specific ATP synthase n=2 Tax=Methylorubrum extorquens TaxID=408 RepID=H1KT03_METEX|nr:MULTISPECIES: flagellar protein export ATPase FliI [Methylobacteriaceae]KQO89257.1 flagellar protein export ATPase FliI [Methylobacterium sp. Leaf92]EHP86051.1 flagellar protein export ATPase FliI [Methylorubrum extorquens DSM 13060]KQQ24040.1 flagellar protein export ATPase FliI [Methylobacterium sp. Leaf122]KQQ30875.1 flagellar protein export ATPase FliI [Methylobacterium sp. Leaf123]WHQ70726.1 flagellar protein export ATPase FliI [Methylorubrum extorquens]